MKRWLMAISGGVLVMMVGCGAAPTNEPAGEATQPITGWLGPVSEETWKNQMQCGETNVGITAWQCQGRYCDDNFMQCAATPGGLFFASPGFWTPYFSEEGANAFFCENGGPGTGINGIVDGVKATGRYSDNISLHCSSLFSGHLTDCGWTGWVSEEQGTMDFSPKFAVGAQCSGSYCDNLRFFVCNVTD
jgi:hypothetical protein